MATPSAEKSDELHFFEEDYSSLLSVMLNNARENTIFCDVQLEIGNETFFAHRAVLGVVSPWFKALFFGEFSESKQTLIRIKSIDQKVMGSLLNYMYTGTITLTATNCENIIAAANILELTSLLNVACDFMGKQIDVYNCLGILHFAQMISQEELKKKAFNFVFKNFRTVIEQEEFLELTPEKLIEIISNDALLVEKEEILFSAVIKWYEIKSEERKSHLHRVMEHVRLPLTNLYFLHDCVELFPAIQAMPECLKLVEEAKAFISLPTRMTNFCNERTKPRSNAVMEEVIVVVGGTKYRGLSSCNFVRPYYWTKMKQLPVEIYDHALVAIRKNLYVAGGFQKKICNCTYSCGGQNHKNELSSQFWKYNSVEVRWNLLKPLKFPRRCLGLVALDDYVYAVGGLDINEKCVDFIERYDLSIDEWCTLQKLKKPVINAAVVALNKMIYIAGGKETSNLNVCEATKHFFRYDPELDIWTELPPLLIARVGAVGCVLNGKIYVIGGQSNKTVERYDVENDVWKNVAPMQKPRYNPGVAVLKNKIYVMGGSEGNTEYNDVECFDPILNKWNIICKLNQGLTGVRCATMMVKKNYV